MVNEIRLSPQFVSPGYSHDTTCLHRYLDSQFFERFNHEVRHDLEPDAQKAWMSEDVMGPYYDQVTLRQPVHRTFYMVSSAISCSRPGHPALDPKKITSAGFVIRRKAASQDNNQIASYWCIDNGNATGWQNLASHHDFEPDIYRRLKQQKIVQAQFPDPLFSGEEIHPMHAQQINKPDGKKQTIIYGYLPIGGSYTPSPEADLRPELLDSQSQIQLKTLLPWGEVNQQENSWPSEDGLLVSHGQSTWRFANILRQSINTFHIGEKTGKDPQFDKNAIANADLFNKFNTLNFFRPTHTNRYENDNTVRRHGVQISELTLANYLENIFSNPDSELHEWLQNLDNTINTQTISDNDFVGLLPELTDNLSHESSTLLSLQLTQADVQDINYLLSQRLQQQLLNLSLDIPLPKFEQGIDDIYYVQPFIRTKENCQESIHWGEASVEFRVAAPFDPEASRPSMIQMPSLDDVKRGIATGVSFLTPASMAKKLKQLRPGKGLDKEIVDDDRSTAPDMEMICSFSLPVISLCAMILLMIVISILNFFFRWIPWVFYCLPFPKTKN